MKKNTRAAISFKALKIETKIATFWFGMESWRTRRRRAVENSLKEQQNIHGPGLRIMRGRMCVRRGNGSGL